MKVIILAAGKGSRLMPYTLNKPKCLVEINDESLIDRQIKILKKNNLNSILIVGGYKHNLLKRNDVELIVNEYYNSTNMLYTLFCAESYLFEEAIISYGDIVYSSDTIKNLLKSNADISVVIDKNWKDYWIGRSQNPLADAETLRLESDGKIIDIGQKPKSIEEIEGQYMGLMKFSKNGFDTLKDFYYRAKKNKKILGKPYKEAYMTDILQEMIQQGVRIDSVMNTDDWVEIDTVSDLSSPLTIDRLSKLK